MRFHSYCGKSTVQLDVLQKQLLSAARMAQLLHSRSLLHCDQQRRTLLWST